MTHAMKFFNYYFIFAKWVQNFPLYCFGWAGGTKKISDNFSGAGKLKGPGQLRK